MFTGRLIFLGTRNCVLDAFLNCFQGSLVYFLQLTLRPWSIKISTIAQYNAKPTTTKKLPAVLKNFAFFTPYIKDQPKINPFPS